MSVAGCLLFISFLTSAEIQALSRLESCQIAADYSSEQWRFSSLCQQELTQIDSEAEID